MNIVLATHNKNKVRELNAILGGLGIEVTPLPADFPDIEENGTTFAENARIKASAVCEALGVPALADDSGLAVDALDGAPGVYSARWAGEDADDHDRNRFLLQKLEGVEHRTARFVCASCCVLPDGTVLEASGSCEGVILTEEYGTGGFGYDPVFYVPEQGCTFGELPAEVKNQISHRSRSFTKMAELLKAGGVICPSKS
ncbi:MAG: XTP/dITP diphosphatase [Butyricicoccaceae bacterium]